MKKTITIVIGTYIPGYKAGGPVRSIENMINSFESEYNFRVITTDRDMGDKKPYDSIQSNKWNTLSYEKIKIFYSKNWKIDNKVIKECNKNTDLFYICGILNIYALKFLLLKRFGKITKPIVIAPMGSLTGYALSIKKLKKHIYIILLNILGLVSDIYWSATSDAEYEEISRQFPKTQKIYIMQDIVKQNERVYFDKDKISGQLNMVFISRIQQKKNLDFAIKILREIKGIISLKIYGPIEDRKYWDMCLEEINKLPPNISVNYCGVLDSNCIVEEFSKNHVFIFPTHSENFGHVIYEALCGECPVIISDKTYWTQDILKTGGTVLPLSDQNAFVNEVQEYVDMDFESYNNHARAAYMCSKNFFRLQTNNNLFKNLIDDICMCE